MKAADPLYELISTMTKSEKRFFALRAQSQGADKEYMKLFRFLEKRKGYDEKEIKKSLEVKKLPRIKNYLYELLVSCLCDYAREAESEKSAQEMLSAVRLLFNRRLFKQCEKMLRRAKRKVELSENFSILKQLLFYDILLMQSRRYATDSSAEVAGIYEEIYKCSEKEQNVLKYKELLTSISIITHKEGVMRSQRKLERFKHIMANPLLKGEGQALSVAALSSYYQCYIAFYEQIGDYKKFVSTYQKKLSLFEKNAHLRLYVLHYPKSIWNMCLGYLYLGEYSQVPAQLDKMERLAKELKGVSPEARKFILHDAKYMEMLMLMGKGDFKLGIGACNEILELNKSWSVPKTDILATNYYLAYAKFAFEDFKAAKGYLNILLENSSFGAKKEIISAAKILTVLNYWEMGDEEMTTHAIRSARNYMEKRDKLYALEKVVLKFLKGDYLYTLSDTEQKALFKSLKKEIVQVLKDPYESRALFFFDILSWLESKISNVSFVEAYRKRLAKNT